MPKTKVTIKDVAREADVNPSVVSRVLNKDSTLKVREETRERVWEAAAKLNYRPNRMAKMLRTKKSKMIAVLISKFSDLYFTAILEGIVWVAEERGYIISVFSTEEDRKKGSKCIETVYEYGMDGAILASSYVEEKTLQQLRYSSVPMVMLRRSSREFGVMGMLADELAGVSMVMEHLIGLGHQKIAHISGELFSRSGLKRFEGYRKALYENGIPYRVEYVQESDQTEKGSYDAMMRLLELEDPPTAVFAFNDTVAFGAMSAIRDKGLRIPDDISVVGHDNTILSEHTYPRLTTVDSRMKDMGELAAKMLIDAIEGKENAGERGEPECDIKIEPRFVVRESTGRVRK
ncbi:LacI family DNA-binding transcriptional regulator [Ruminococcus gauvreauii]|uniref:LacI family transcriptional regulator n=1 Tax=Ruminococcus gauvreauii TaxID=438033 RepID=A0ABY5VF90_9FIRM|nr:LacI family DNA-binding transcriptional regulator [Ruminococcus gauvreauii]UWP58977.1 LacI family transcriptional regulator [Ruminococcus gauvreauii]